MEEIKKMGELKDKFFNQCDKTVEKLKEQQRHNVWFIHNFIMEDENMKTPHIEEPPFKSKAEKFNWYLKQINLK